MQIVTVPTPTDRLRRAYRESEAVHGDPLMTGYAHGFLDAVRQILGTTSCGALICDLDGNPLPTLADLMAPPEDAA